MRSTMIGPRTLIGSRMNKFLCC